VEALLREARTQLQIAKADGRNRACSVELAMA
jgi:hypothetical protein